MSLPGPLRWLCNLVMIILVQLLMLVQCAITYYLMRRRARRDLAPVPMQLATFSHDGQIAVVVVTYNEAANIAETLDRLASVTSTAASIAVYVIDGGSKDGTVALVESKAADPKFPLHIHTGAATGGRGPCQQKGVDMAAATADIILFLHADTELCASHRIIVSYSRALVIGASRVSSNMCLEPVRRFEP